MTLSVPLALEGLLQGASGVQPRTHWAFNKGLQLKMALTQLRKFVTAEYVPAPR